MSSPDGLRCTLSEEDGMVRGTSFTANTRLTLMQIARGGAGDDEQATRNEDDSQQPAARRDKLPNQLSGAGVNVV